jgi:hypothetical protein
MAMMVWVNARTETEGADMEEEECNLEEEFRDAMIRNYRLAAEVDPSLRCDKYLEGARSGGIDYAKELLRKAKGEAGAGFKKLKKFHRLDLSVEYLVLRMRWRGLFTKDLLAVAEWQLGDNKPPEE